MLKNILRVLGVLSFLAGLIFFLQGINVLPRSYMSGQIQWAINGGILMGIGVGLFILSNRWR